jgi:sulfoquinovosyltransferase
LAPAEYLHYFGLNFRIFTYLVKKFMSWFYARAHVVTAPSEHILDELYDYGMRVKHREVVSNPVKLDFFTPLPNKQELKEKYGVGERAVLLFGRIAIEKNLAFAAEVFKEVAIKTDAQLIILGGGPYEKELQEKIRELRLTNKTKFLGVLRGEQLVEALNTAEVLLVTSLSEIQPMATLQAMSLGLPVVAARAGGMPSVVVDGTTGYLVDPTDKEAYAKKIIELLNDEELRKNFGEAARQAVQGYYPKQIAEKFLHIYQRARGLSQK